MSILVTDRGFSPDDWTGENGDRDTLDLTPDVEPSSLASLLDGVALIRIRIPGFADGRGFSLARRLRDLGYAGRLRAAGHVLPDQYAMARRAGFDEVEIDDALAARAPEADWLARADWQAHDYQSRLRG